MAQSCKNSSLAADDTHKDVNVDILTGTIGVRQAVHAIAEDRRKSFQCTFILVSLGDTLKSYIHTYTSHLNYRRLTLFTFPALDHPAGSMGD